jgi:hypothetical protein
MWGFITYVTLKHVYLGASAKQTPISVCSSNMLQQNWHIWWEQPNLAAQMCGGIPRGAHPAMLLLPLKLSLDPNTHTITRCQQDDILTTHSDLLNVTIILSVFHWLCAIVSYIAESGCLCIVEFGELQQFFVTFTAEITAKMNKSTSIYNIQNCLIQQK